MLAKPKYKHSQHTSVKFRGGHLICKISLDYHDTCIIIITSIYQHHLNHYPNYHASQYQLHTMTSYPGCKKNSKVTSNLFEDESRPFNLERDLFLNSTTQGHCSIRFVIESYGHIYQRLLSLVGLFESTTIGHGV